MSRPLFPPEPDEYHDDAKFLTPSSLDIGCSVHPPPRLPTSPLSVTTLGLKVDTPRLENKIRQKKEKKTRELGDHPRCPLLFLFLFLPFFFFFFLGFLFYFSDYNYDYNFFDFIFPISIFKRVKACRKDYCPHCSQALYSLGPSCTLTRAPLDC